MSVGSENILESIPHMNTYPVEALNATFADLS